MTSKEIIRKRWQRSMDGVLAAPATGVGDVTEDIDLELPASGVDSTSDDTEGSDLLFPPKQSVLSRLARLIIRMQNKETGVKTFKQTSKQLESTGSCVAENNCFCNSGVDGAFSPTAIVEWIMANLSTESHLETCHLVTMLCRMGFIFPCKKTWKATTIHINEPDEETTLRFQAPFFWPTDTLVADEADFACHLYGRQNGATASNLDEFESKYLAKIEKVFRGKWDFVKKTSSMKQSILGHTCATMQVIYALQEYSYWKVNRPPCYIRCAGGRVNELWAFALRGLNKKFPPSNEDDVSTEKTKQTTTKTNSPSKVLKLSCNKIITNCADLTEVDPLITTDETYHNPWRGESIHDWPPSPTRETGPYKMQCKTWGLNFDAMLKEELGRWLFEQHLKREFSVENLDFYCYCVSFKSAPQCEMDQQIKQIYNTFICPKAETQVNIDTQTLKKVRDAIKDKSRFVFDPALDHIYTLMRKDSYKRFIKSSTYKEALAQATNPTRYTKEKKQLPKIWRLSQFLPKKKLEDELP